MLLVLQKLDTEMRDWVRVRQEFTRRSDGDGDQPRIDFASDHGPANEAR